jgi:hypothetical protein
VWGLGVGRFEVVSRRGGGGVAEATDYCRSGSLGTRMVDGCFRFKAGRPWDHNRSVCLGRRLHRPP